MLRYVWRTVGNNTLDREGVDRLHNLLLSSCGAAGAVRRAMGKATASEFFHIMGGPATRATVIRRHHDATPWRVQFGSCYERLFPSARDPLQDGGKWRLASRDEYLRVHPNARLSYGCLEGKTVVSTMLTSQGQLRARCSQLCLRCENHAHNCL